MLQIIILHDGEKANILEIKDIDVLEQNIEPLCSYDASLKQTVLEPIQDYIGELVLLTHFNRTNNCTMYDYEQVRILSDVGKDEKGFWYFDTTSVNQ